MNRRTFILAGMLIAQTIASASAPAAERASLKVGMTMAGQPASGINADTSMPEGFAIDLMLAIAADAGLNVYFRPMTFGELQQSLLDGKIDIIAGSYGITPERQKVVDFTRPYGAHHDVLIVKSSDNGAYRTVADLKGRRISTSRGSSFVKPLQDAGTELNLSATIPESIAKLETGAVDGVVENGMIASYVLRNRTGVRIADGYQPILTSSLAFAVRKDDGELRARLDQSLAKLQASGVVTQVMKSWGVESR